MKKSDEKQSLVEEGGSSIDLERVRKVLAGRSFRRRMRF